MSNMYKGYDTERILKEQEIIQALKNYEAEYGSQALEELIGKLKAK
ncbi:hypothetical protein PUS82_00240 [Cytobacillus firmus]|nr:hypothetical protein [Cytobacillus firmus]MDD9309760.1 hypothetical protein [Cytobacillus firmus]